MISVKIGFFFQEITFITEFQGREILLPTFSLGGKWGLEVADLLLATVNFELCYCTNAYTDLNNTDGLANSVNHCSI